MVRLGAMLFLLLGLATGPVAAAEPGDAIRAVITAQLRAFQADDAETAFSFAAPVIKWQFRDPDTFMAMVRHGYPAVYRPRSVAFGALKQVGAEWAQDVHFIGPDGTGAIGRYIMQRQDDGNWQIAGVYMRPVPELGA
ncbi:MAG: DUF4864 domain-containing protein [Pseudomonadota bacterium]|nr:DUF4864 domain-containing protein [Pseudomonadota bacterium]